MRIISGSLKGRRITGFHPHRHRFIRPMTDRVKESLFGVLTPFLNEKVLFLDLFSGTGSLSFEALSRGVLKAHAVESHPQALRIIEKNKALLKKPEKLICHKKNVFSFLKSSKLGPFHITVADPPFTLQAGSDLLESFSRSHLYMRGSIFVIETGLKEQLPENCFCFQLFSMRDFSDKKVWFYEARQIESGSVSRQL